MGLGNPPLNIKIMLELSPPKSRILVQRLAVPQAGVPLRSGDPRAAPQTQKAHVLRPISVLRFWISEGLTQAESENWGAEFSCPWGTSHNSESANLSRDNLSREIGRTSDSGRTCEASRDDPKDEPVAGPSGRPIWICLPPRASCPLYIYIYIYIYTLCLFTDTLLGRCRPPRFTRSAGEAGGAGLLLY